MCSILNRMSYIILNLIINSKIFNWRVVPMCFKNIYIRSPSHEITTLDNHAFILVIMNSMACRYLHFKPYDIYVEDATRRLSFHAVSEQTNLSKLSFS